MDTTFQLLQLLPGRQKCPNAALSKTSNRSNLRFIPIFSKVTSGKRKLSSLKLCLYCEGSLLSCVV